MVHLKYHFDPLSIPSTKKQTKNVSVGAPLTKLSGSAHVCYVKCNEFDVCFVIRSRKVRKPT